jgi:hypothetical protein
MKTADEQYKQGFYDELKAFRERVQQRAKQKVDEAMKQYEEASDRMDTTSILCSCSMRCFLGRTTETFRSRRLRSNRSDGILA